VRRLTRILSNSDAVIAITAAELAALVLAVLVGLAAGDAAASAFLLCGNGAGAEEEGGQGDYLSEIHDGFGRF
jgi:hypothetical protein